MPSVCERYLSLGECGDEHKERLCVVLWFPMTLQLFSSQKLKKKQKWKQINKQTKSMAHYLAGTLRFMRNHEGGALNRSTHRPSGMLLKHLLSFCQERAWQALFLLWPTTVGVLSKHYAFTVCLITKVARRPTSEQIRPFPLSPCKCQCLQKKMIDFLLLSLHFKICFILYLFNLLVWNNFTRHMFFFHFVCPRDET